MNPRKGVAVSVYAETERVMLLVTRDGDSFKTENLFSGQPHLPWNLIRESLDGSVTRRINSL